MMKYRWFIGILIIALTTHSGQAKDVRPNGFDVSNASIPVDKILDGGVGKDGIPSINRPEFIRANAVTYVGDGETVISFTGKNGETRAYPIRILIKHEIVNDKIDGQAIIVTYCPLCASAMVFASSLKGKDLIFGVSGLLYQSDVLMYDRDSQSLWTQLGMQSVSGTNVGERLKWLPSEQMTFAAWKKKYPQGKVLSIKTGFMRNYEFSGYGQYFSSPEPAFPVPFTRTEFPKKSYVGGVIRNGKQMAFPLKQLPPGKEIEIQLGGETIKVSYDRKGRQLRVFEADGKTPVPTVIVFWFAWQAFYPETEIWKP